MLEVLLKYLIEFPALISFIGPFIFGGETILLLSIIATQGTIPFWEVMVFCALGILTADTMWFLVGRIEPLKKLKRIKIIHKGYLKAIDIINEFETDISLLILIKFAYGPGIPILMYLGRKRMTFKRYLLYNTSIILIWTLAIGLAGWLIGKGYYLTKQKFESIWLGIAVAITLIAIGHVVIKKIRKKFLNKYKKK